MANGSAAVNLLGDVNFLLTRPADQAAVSARLLSDAGINVLSLPMLAIDAIPLANVRASFPAHHWHQADIVILVSQNAAQFLAPVAKALGGIPASTRVLSIGKATASTWAALGGSAAEIAADGEDSEALLRLPVLVSSAGKRIVLVRGESASGGRKLLGKTLSDRGANVTELVCYRRAPLSLSLTDQVRLDNFLRLQGLGIIQVLSTETLDSLMQNLDDRQTRKHWRLLVPHPRIAAAARATGWHNVHLASASGEPLLHDLIQLMPELKATATF